MATLIDIVFNLFAVASVKKTNQSKIDNEKNQKTQRSVNKLNHSDNWFHTCPAKKKQEQNAYKLNKHSKVTYKNTKIA